MSNDDELTHTQEFLATHRRTLKHLLRQSAQYGGEAFAPTHVANGIAEAREGVQTAKARLQAKGIAVDDDPDDYASPITKNSSGPTSSGKGGEKTWQKLTPIIVAVIGLIGTLGAALIGGLLRASPGGTPIAFPSSVSSSPSSVPTVAIVPTTTVRASPVTPNISASEPVSPTTSEASACLSGTIYFASNRDGNFELYKMNPDGSGQQRLTTNADDDIQPRLSPDGSKILFVSNQNSMSDIYVIDVNGQNLRRLTTEEGEDPTWSPDGSRIAFASNRTGNSEIYVMNVDGSDVKRITLNDVNDFRPSWSPDGSKVVYASRVSKSNTKGPWDIHMVNADGSNDTLVFSNGSMILRPVWSPDGKSIAFATALTGNWEIYTVEVNGSNPRRLTSDPANDVEVAWSPDAQCLAFVRELSSTNREIYVMDRTGNILRRLTRNEHSDWYITWSL